MKTHSPLPHRTSPTDSQAEPANTPSLQRYQSSVFFGESQEIEIEHNGAIYRLRKTSLGKLILTK